MELPRAQAFRQEALFGGRGEVLVWDLMERPRLTRWLEALLNPVLGKSVVMYFQKAPVP